MSLPDVLCSYVVLVCRLITFCGSCVFIEVVQIGLGLGEVTMAQWGMGRV